MALAVFAIFLFAYFLVAAVLDRWSIGPALAFAIAGLVVGAAGLGIIDSPVESEIVVTLAELTLALVLFSDAASLDMTGAGDDTTILARLLSIGLLATIALGTVVALILFPGSRSPSPHWSPRSLPRRTRRLLRRSSPIG